MPPNDTALVAGSSVVQVKVALVPVTSIAETLVMMGGVVSVVGVVPSLPQLSPTSTAKDSTRMRTAHHTFMSSLPPLIITLLVDEKITFL